MTKRFLSKFTALLLLAGLICQPAMAEWRRAESEKFIVYADASEDVVRGYAEHLERFDLLLRHFTGINPEPPEVKLTIYLVPGLGRLQRRMGGGGYISGIYIPDMRGPYAVGTVRSQGTLFHEYVHHFMLQNAPAAYPLWYREGFAEFFATVIFDEEGHAQIGTFPRSRSNSLVYSRRYRFSDVLQERRSVNPIANYTLGWALVHHSIFHEDTREMLQQYLTLINAGQTSEQAYLATFANADGDLEDRLKDYTRGDMPSSVTTRTFNPENDIQVTELSEAQAEIQMLYPRRKEYLEREILSAVRRYPDSPDVHAELAQLRLAQNRLDDAIQTANQALALDAGHVEANVFKGTALLRQAAASGNAADARWEESRRHFITANRADPSYPLALLRYYQSFPDRNNRPDNAMAALEQAYLFVPQNSGVRLQLALEFLSAGRFDEAILVSRPLAQNPHSTNDIAEAARTVIERARAQDSNTEIEDIELADFISED